LYFTSDESLQEAIKNIAKIEEMEKMAKEEKRWKNYEKTMKDLEEEKIAIVRRQMAKLGRLKFPGSVVKNINPNSLGSNKIVARVLKTEYDLRKEHNKPKEMETRGIRIVPWDTFVQPGVDQVYPYATAVPPDTKYVMVPSSFQYGQVPSKM